MGSAAKVAIETLTTMAGFVTASLLKDQATHEAVASVLQDEQLREVACEYFSALVGTYTAEEQEVCPTAPVIHAVLACLKGKAFDAEGYDFHKSLCGLLVQIGRNQLAAKEAHRIEASALEALLQTLLVFCEHPSQLLASSYTAWFWTDLFHNKEWLARNPTVIPFALPVLVRFVENKFLKVGGPDDDDSPACEFSAIDFDTEKDHITMCGSLRSRVIVLTAALAAADPGTVVNYLGERTQATLALITKGEADSDKMKLATASVQLDALMSMMSPALERSQADTSPYDPQLGAITSLMLQHATTDLSVMSLSLTGLSALAPHLKRAPGTLLAVMQLILKRMWHMEPGEALQFMSPSVVGLRRKAGTVLGHIFKQVGEPALAFCEELETMAQGLFSKGQATATEMAMLHEAMLGAVATRGIVAMMDFSKSVLVGPMATAQSLQAPLQNPLAFLQALGITRGGDGGATAVQARKEVYGALRHIWVLCRTHVEVYKEVQPGGKMTSLKCPWTAAETGFFPHFNMALPSVMMLASATHQLHSPQVKATVSPGLEGIYKPGAMEGDAVAMEPGLESGTDTTAVRRWLREMRELTYGILGLAVAHGSPAYEIIAVDGVLERTVFLGAEDIPDSHLTAMIRSFVLPLLRHCPPQHMPGITRQVSGLLQKVYNRISPKWLEVSQRAKPGVSTSEKPLSGIGPVGGRNSPGPAVVTREDQEEIAGDTRLRDLTRELITALSAMLGSPPADGIAPDACPPELSRYLIMSEDVVAPVLMTVISAVEWPDKIVERLSHRCGRCLVYLLAQHHGAMQPRNKDLLSHFLGGELMKASIRAALQQGQRMHGDFDGALLIRDIYVRLGGIAPHPRQIFLSLSERCTQARLEQFDKKIALTKEKAQRALFRDFFVELELTEELQRRKLKSVPTLPEKFVVLGDVWKAQAAEAEAKRSEEQQGVGLAALFGTDV